MLSGCSGLWAQQSGMSHGYRNPQFPGGIDSLERFIFDHAKYPGMAEKDVPKGIIYASFIVEANGSINHIVIIKGNSSTLLDSITKACIAAMPRWIAGKVSNKPTPMRVLLPVSYPPGNQLYNVSDTTLIK